jgi:hypothetical protein
VRLTEHLTTCLFGMDAPPAPDVRKGAFSPTPTIVKLARHCSRLKNKVVKSCAIRRNASTRAFANHPLP